MKNIHKYTFLGSIGQWLSVFIMGYGIYLLFTYKIDYGTIFFSSGCLIETLSTKLKYYGKKYVKKSSKLVHALLTKSECEDKLVSTASVALPEPIQFF